MDVFDATTSALKLTALVLVTASVAAMIASVLETDGDDDDDNER